MSLRLCTRCAGSHLRRCMLSDLRPRLTPFSSLHTSFILRHESTKSEDLEDALNSSQTTAKARARAWYLDDPNTSSSSDPTTSSSTDPSELPYPSPLPMTVSSFTTEPTQPPPIPKSSTDTETRQPQFTTFDPSRTTALPPTRSIVPLPPNTPDYLRPLHAYLTSDQAAEVLDPSSVVFLHTPSAPIWSVGPGELIRGETEAGARWEWVVVLEVKGTGKGVVGRAERAIRLWLHNNPLPPGEKRRGETSNPKLPRVPESTDWSLISPRHSGVCLNLFTGEGRERWDLEELWSGRSTLLSRNELQ